MLNYYSWVLFHLALLKQMSVLANLLQAFRNKVDLCYLLFFFTALSLKFSKFCVCSVYLMLCWNESGKVDFCLDVKDYTFEQGKNKRLLFIGEDEKCLVALSPKEHSQFRLREIRGAFNLNTFRSVTSYPTKKSHSFLYMYSLGYM